MKFRLNCRESSRLLSQAQDARLGLGTRVALHLHLSVCDACTQFSKQLDFLRRAMRAWPDAEAPPEQKNTR